MKSFIIFNLLVITTINPIVNSHENHDHQIYNWSSSKNKNIKKESTFNREELEVIKTNNKSSWKNFFQKTNQFP